jgi:hypothetical protein
MRFLTLLTAFTLYATIGAAQGNYWAQQFGADATLIGGGVTAGVRDNSAIFYNPGAMGFLDSTRISISANLYGIDVIKIKNGAGNGIDLKSFKTNIIPQIVAGSIKIKKVPNLKILYGTLTRFRANTRFNLEEDAYHDVVPLSPGEEYYKARLEYQHNMVEQWAGLGLAYKVNDMFSVGFTAFGSYTNIETRSSLNTNTDALYNGQPYTATVNEFNSLRFDQLSLIFKVGVAAKFKRVKLGLTVAMPSAKVWGRGRLDKSLEAYNLNLNATDTTNDVFKYPSLLIADEQARLKTHYKLPASFAVGAEYAHGILRVCLSGEFFFGLPAYDVVRGVDRVLVRPASAFGNSVVPNFMRVRTELKPVFNFGIGTEVRVSAWGYLLAGFRTDFSNRSDYLPGSDNFGYRSFTSPNWQYMHITAGGKYKFSSHELMIGLNYGIGTLSSNQQLINLSEPQQQYALHGLIQKRGANTTIHSPGLVIGYTYYFKDNPKQKTERDSLNLRLKKFTEKWKKQKTSDSK